MLLHTLFQTFDPYSTSTQRNCETAFCQDKNKPSITSQWQTHMLLSKSTGYDDTESQNFIFTTFWLRNAASAIRMYVRPSACLTITLDRSFTAAGPSLWNTLSSMLWQMTGYGQFRRHMKAHLFRAYESRRIVLFDFLRHTNTRYSYLLIFLLT